MERLASCVNNSKSHEFHQKRKRKKRKPNNVTYCAPASIFPRDAIFLLVLLWASFLYFLIILYLIDMVGRDGTLSSFYPVNSINLTPSLHRSQNRLTATSSKDIQFVPGVFSETSLSILSFLVFFSFDIWTKKIDFIGSY